MPHGVEAIPIAAIFEPTVVAIVEPVIERDPCNARVAARRERIVTIAIPRAYPPVSTLAIFIVAPAHTAAATFTVAVFVVYALDAAYGEVIRAVKFLVGIAGAETGNVSAGCDKSGCAIVPAFCDGRHAGGGQRSGDEDRGDCS